MSGQQNGQRRYAEILIVGLAIVAAGTLIALFLGVNLISAVVFAIASALIREGLTAKDSDRRNGRQY